MAFQLPTPSSSRSETSRQLSASLLPQASSQYFCRQQNKRARQTPLSKSLQVSQPSTRPLQAVAERTQTSISAAPEASATWYACIANAEFMLNDVQNESFAEQLRERKRLFSEKNKELDFFLVSEPTWLDQKFPAEANRVGRPCVALVSPDRVWMRFMKLRLDRVLLLELGQMDPADVFKSGGPVPEFKKPEKWTAPYAPYAPGWWNVFMPGQK